MYKVKVQMKRGGFMPMLIDALVYKDSDGSGRRWTEVEIRGIEWPHGGKVNEKNIADIGQVEDAVLEAAEKAKDDR
jgi:hypothetical protein